MKILRDSILLIGSFGLIWALFTYVPVFEDVDVGISMEQEEHLGKVIMETFYDSKTHQRIENNAADSALRKIATRLQTGLGLTEYDYNIILVKDESINAFTLPGGNIVVLTGLMEFAENPEEVASVLAHEMGHVEKRHVVDRLVAEFSLTVLFSVLTGGDGVLLQDILQTLLSQGFSRTQEEEADAYALDLLVKSSVSPRALASFFRRLNTKYGTADDQLEILLSHPAKNSRIKSSLEYKIPEEFEAKDFELDWEKVKASI
ncbi:MAG: M48 family metallopeptidase [Flavobacteriales bacterium]|nr:M48 family metallopeptidase [Flavobacteriales bacterium]